ncbi:uncharacterized protein LOC143850235 [Tasmannia lanceolata]|uniref:uncharacterized protein LOC143850235 n=1 Tax=Tasmannia lanceolata TaxID=3420 RepID=UPI0040642482
MGIKTNSPNKFTHYMKAPARALCRARDFYVRSMIKCSGSVNYGGAAAGPMMASSLPKSFSTNSSRASTDDDDLREVMRMVSQKSMREKVQNLKATSRSNGLPKSFSVAIGRIDEDMPCNFQEDLKAKSDVFYPRSRSYAVGKRRTEFIG